MPFDVGISESFQKMILSWSPKMTIPAVRTILKYPSIKKEEVTRKLKLFLSGKPFAMTTDHWTSAANDNYAALTIHVIDNFKLKRIVLSCVQHAGGTAAEEMDKQLVSDLELWGLKEANFVALFTDTAANMNLLGCMLEEQYANTSHLYWADHNIQLTAVKAFSGSMKEKLTKKDSSIGDTEYYEALKKARDLVSHVSQSTLSKKS
jgi:hypothetical protein